MPKRNLKLTEKEIQKAGPRAKAYRLYDADGLTLLIRPSGTKVWQYRYIFAGKSNVYTIGKVGVISSNEARKKLLGIKDLLKQGKDPNQHKQATRLQNLETSHNTFESIAREWYGRQTWAPKHAKNIMNRLEKDVFIRIGGLPIDEVTIPNMVNIIQTIETRGAGDVARRINQYCTAIFEYAIAKGICNQNPAMGRTRILKPMKRSNRRHLQTTDLQGFIENLRGNPLKNQILQLGVELMTLTFVRPIELRDAT